MIILPIRTSIWPRRTPYANYALIVVNVVIFLLAYGHHRILIGNQPVLVPIQKWAEQFMLTPNGWRWWQFVSYAFLHGGFWHIFFNMYFLYLFGNNVNDKLGHVGYLCFYLGGAVFSGIGHTVLHLSSAVPTLGASGAVAAITGAYLVLFPQTLITVIYWLFWFLGTMEVPALYFIAFKMILIDNIIARYTPSVAYDAHLSGYAFGIAGMLAMLATGMVTVSNFDLWAMIKQWNRRRQYRDAVASGYDPFTGQTRKKIKVKEIKKTATQQEREETIKKLREEIGSRMTERNLPAAAELYLELMMLDSEQILPRQQLLDIANQLASDKKAAESARAYEQFLANYSNYEHAEQVELMLGILYSRYLNERQLAAKYLESAAQKLTDLSQMKMCQEELSRLKD